MRRGFVAALVVAFAAFGAGSAADAIPAARGSLDDETVTVGSFDFAESRLLAELYAQALERRGVDVRRTFGVGPREVLLPAMAEGLVELVPEYSGTALRFTSLGDEDSAPDPAATHRLLQRRLESFGVRALDAAPAQDTNTFVVTATTAARYGLASLSDLAAVAPDLAFGGPPECPTRPLCLSGLERVYDVHFDEVIELDAGGPLTKQALRSRAVDVALLFSTDPDLAGGRFVELVDDRGLQPAENVTPLVRREVLDRLGPSVAEPVNEVSALLTTDALRGLNAEMQRGSSVRAVVGRWLDAQGLR
jgi:osmoprotectant transport system substrate-binding protein